MSTKKAAEAQVPNAIGDKIIFTAAGKCWVAQVIQQGDDVPTFGSQVEDFAGLDVTNAEAKKLTEPAPVAPAANELEPAGVAAPKADAKNGQQQSVAGSQRFARFSCMEYRGKTWVPLEQVVEEFKAMRVAIRAPRAAGEKAGKP